jgi:CubicO group peptidase (beta-lactamase class C family)
VSALGSVSEGIDAVLRRGVENGAVPGVVAMAATDRGVCYEGAFGVRDLEASGAMSLETVFRIASMTKAVTSVAALQLVEAGKLDLDAPAGEVMPELAAPQVLDGFDAAGEPRLRPARRPITLRHLLTHTAGFGYEVWNPDLARYVEKTGMPSILSGKLAALAMPLAFDPGERWQYGINIDWVGRIVEEVSGERLDAYFRDHIFAPLGMVDSGFAATPGQRAREARIHLRQPDGGLVPAAREEAAPAREFLAGGGGLSATAPDYLAFLSMLLHQGAAGSTRILRPETVAALGENHIGNLPAGIMKSVRPELSNDVDLLPGNDLRWGLAAMINLRPVPGGRSAGSLSWAGLFNTYYWVDPQKRLAGLIMTQILPFADTPATRLYADFERALYTALDG